MTLKRTAILAFYAAIIVMMLFVYFYVQRHFSYEQSHGVRADGGSPRTTALISFSSSRHINATLFTHIIISRNCP